MWWLAALEEHEKREVERALTYVRHSRRKSPEHEYLLTLAKVALIADNAIHHYKEKVDIDDILSNCNYSKSFITTANDLQILDAISSCYEEYRILNRGN